MEGTTEPCAPGPRRKEQLPHRKLANGCPGVSSGDVGQWRPAAGLGALSVAVHAWGLLKEVAIIFIASTIVSVQFSSVAQWCPTLCDPMNCSTPGLPVHHHLQSSLKLTFIESVMPSSHLILCCPLLLLPISPSVRVFSNESTLHIRWPKYWSFSFSIIPSKEHPGLISFRMEWLDLLAV